MNKPRLPIQIQYLQRVVDKLARLAPDKLNDDTDTSLLVSALCKRIETLSARDACKQLADDRDQLKCWLDSRGRKNQAGHYVYGYLMGSLLFSTPREIIKNLRTPPVPPMPTWEICFELPEGWRAKHIAGGIQFKKRGIIGGISRANKDIFEMMPRDWDFAKKRFKSTETRVDIRKLNFGRIRGVRFVMKQQSPSQFMSADYVLAVPGGFVDLSLFSKAEMDLLPLEAQLPTLRIIKKKNANKSRSS